jgi:hypothetical protein
MHAAAVEWRGLGSCKLKVMHGSGRCKVMLCDCMVLCHGNVVPGGSHLFLPRALQQLGVLALKA